jgi:L-aminopeptidase/D-esterase-like protein
MFDGDVVFTLSTGVGGSADAEAFLELAEAAGDVIGEAIERSVAAV